MKNKLAYFSFTKTVYWIDSKGNKTDVTKDFKAIMELIQKTDIKRCPKCQSTDVIMFTADLDLCNNCGQTF